MRKSTSLILHLLLAVIVIVELTGRFTDNINLEYFVKPLIMIWMVVYFLIFRKKKEFTLPVLVAFFFFWIGDNFLMFSGKDEIFFFAGVGGFFILIYALTLIGMSMMALNRNTRVNHASFLLVFIGSVLFVISDNMIALDKFYMEFSLAGFWFIITYIAAQYLIMRGLILEK